VKQYQLAGLIASKVQWPIREDILWRALKDGGWTHDRRDSIEATLDDLVCEGDLIAVYYGIEGQVRKIYFPGHMRVEISDECFRNECVTRLSY
jgi:hypothetical protein